MKTPQSSGRPYKLAIDPPDDVETEPGQLTISATSTNPTLIPPGNIVLGGGGANRTITITPVSDQSGSATITITVSDGDAAGVGSSPSFRI